MRVELFPFQKRALADIRMKTAEAMGSYHRTHAPQVVSFTAPTGAGKTIIMSALIEAILFGDEQYVEQQDAIIDPDETDEEETAEERTEREAYQNEDDDDYPMIPDDNTPRHGPRR